MITRLLLGLVAVVGYASLLSAQQAHYGNGPALLPDLQITPGKAAITNKESICTTKWGKDERHVTPAMKKQA
jgi:hypothetical protein